MKSIATRIGYVALEASIACILLALLLCGIGWMWDDSTYASRWHGECTGWTESVTLLHTVSDGLTAWTYFALAIALARLHPVLKFVRSSFVTLCLIAAVFASCGLVHGLAVFTNFEPFYLQSGMIKLVAAVIGVFGFVFVAHNLIVAGDRMRLERRQLKSRENSVG